MKKYAVLVAGGQGTRMGQELPKQFLALLGKPVLLHTLKQFQGIADEIILVLTPTHIEYWRQLIGKHPDVPAHRVVAGGNSRTESVQNGLTTIDGEGLVAIHDAVRPLVSRELILRAYDTAALYGSAIPVTEMRETLREKSGNTTLPADRSRYVAVQTPQCFSLVALRNAYQLAEGSSFTDDATVFGNAGFQVVTIPGESANIKITWPEDLLFAEALLRERM